jgi:hypothetical protein
MSYANSPTNGTESGISVQCDGMLRVRGRGSNVSELRDCCKGESCLVSLTAELETDKRKNHP